MTNEAAEEQYLRQTLRNLDGARQYEDQVQADSGGWSVSPGSSLAGDDAKTHPYQVSHNVWQALTVAVDHLHCFRRSLAEEVKEGEIALTLHTHSQYSLLRGAMENSARAVWMLGPASRLLRVERRLALQAKDHKDSDKMNALLKRVPNRTLTERMDQLVRLMQKADPTISDDAEALKRLRSGAQPTDIVRAAGDLAVMGADEANLVWSACSSLAHGDVHGTLSILEREVVRTEGGTSLTRLSSDPKILFWATDRTIGMLHLGFRLFQERSTSYLLGRPVPVPTAMWLLERSPHLIM
ncbi:hypothetical protein AB0F39_16340 [Streptomyces murinus]|uniref:hypothetical protein n=1 Tax=Streptomyces murinus TaxID=33900 RepID=UPI0033F4DA63